MSKEAFLKQFDSIPASLPLQGIARAEIHNGLDFPTLRDEKWKYTRVSPILEAEYKHHDARIDSIESWRTPGLDAVYVVFVNGIYHPALSDELPTGVTMHAMDAVDGLIKEEMLAKLGSLVHLKSEAFHSFNTAYFQDGAYMVVQKNTVVEKPVVLLNIQQGERQATNVRNLIHVGSGAEFSLIHDFEGHHNQGAFTNAVTEFFVDENAKADYYMIENEGDDTSTINALYTSQNRDSRLSIMTVTKSGQLVRNNIHAAITDQGCETNMWGVYLCAGNQHVDNQTYADHQKPNCVSNELYKGVMADRSTGVFNGKIMVHKDAQQTNAFQSNQNILLSDRATINTKPELEIYADDVKCSHGCTVGQLDEEALFYLRSRGLGMEAAHQLLIRAFAAEVIENIKIEALRDDVERFIESRFA